MPERAAARAALVESDVNRTSLTRTADAASRWNIEDHHPRHGLWVEIEQVPLTTACHFQLGEQRFLLRGRA